MLFLALAHSSSFFICQPHASFFYHLLLIPCVVQRPGKSIHVALPLPDLLPTLGFTFSSPVTPTNPKRLSLWVSDGFSVLLFTRFPQRSLTNRNVCVLILVSEIFSSEHDVVHYSCSRETRWKNSAEYLDYIYISIILLLPLMHFFKLSFL